MPHMAVLHRRKFPNQMTAIPQSATYPHLTYPQLHTSPIHTSTNLSPLPTNTYATHHVLHTADTCCTAVQNSCFRQQPGNNITLSHWPLHICVWPCSVSHHTACMHIDVVRKYTAVRTYIIIRKYHTMYKHFLTCSCEHPTWFFSVIKSFQKERT